MVRDLRAPCKGQGCRVFGLVEGIAPSCSARCSLCAGSIPTMRWISCEGILAGRAWTETADTFHETGAGMQG